MIEFSLNTTYHESIKTTPFELLFGYNPTVPLGLGDALLADTNIEVQNRLGELQQARLVAEQVMERNQELKIKAAQRHSTRHDLKEGDLVLVSIKYLHLGHQSYSKILPRYIGPFRIMKMVTPNSTLLFWQDLCLASPTSVSRTEASIIEGFKRSRPILHVRWLRKFEGQTSNPDQAIIVQVLDHRRKHNADFFKTAYKDGSTQWLTQDQLLLAMGSTWFNAELDRLSSEKAHTLKGLKKQINQSNKELASRSRRIATQKVSARKMPAKETLGDIPSSSKRVISPADSGAKKQRKLKHNTKVPARWQVANEASLQPRIMKSGRVSKPAKHFDA